MKILPLFKEQSAAIWRSRLYPALKQHQSSKLAMDAMLKPLFCLG
jgi:hypothetical protein